jgi:outer membrane receptor protein involved in Fe transport
VRWIGPGKFRTDWNETDLDDNSIPHRTYFNLSGDFDVNDNVQVYGVVANLFDQDPPIAPNIAWPTNPQYYDMIGRTYKVGVRLKY